MIAAIVAAAIAASIVKHQQPQRSAQPEAEQIQVQKQGSTPEETPQIEEVFIEVNIPATEMTLFEGGAPLFKRKVAIGQGVYPTPVQESFIKRIEWNPWWYPPPDAPWAKGAKPTPPGPGNPLGLVKIPLSAEILFHGTNKDWSVGHPASHGCMRMHNRDVTELAWFLQERFSEKRDPALREIYAKNHGTTYNVQLSSQVPVRIVYRPVSAQADFLMFYPDHYHRVTANKKGAIITELLRAGYDISVFDESVIDGLAKAWPIGAEISIKDLQIERPAPDFSAEASCE